MVNIEKHKIEIETCKIDHEKRDNTFTVAVLEQASEVAKELQEYRAAEEQGLLLRLPCKVGDEVYYINFSQGKVEEDTVMEFSLETFDWYVRLRHSKWVHLDIFKINFYPTKEEAEQKLASMQKGE